jgi:hypothetical protein
MADQQTVVIAITLEDVEEVNRAALRKAFQMRPDERAGFGTMELVRRYVSPALEMLHDAHEALDVHWSYLGVLDADDSEVTAFASRRIGGGK